MKAKAVRPKARRAKLQAAEAPRQEADAIDEMAVQPATPLRDSLSSDEEHKESEGRGTGELLRGHKFYLARTLSADRRADLREIITQNGGVVVATIVKGETVELVRRDQLPEAKKGDDWVAAEFVEDSIRDGELKAVEDYMGKSDVQRAMDEIRLTASGRNAKRPYTDEEDATMLQYIRDKHPIYYSKTSVPERIWRIAATEKLLDRTFASMHQRYRTRLVTLPPEKRAALYRKVGMENPEERKDPPAAPQEEEVASQQDEGEEEQEAPVEKSPIPAESRKRSREPPQEEQQEAEEDGEADKEQAEQAAKDAEGDSEIQGRAKKRRKKFGASRRKAEALEALGRKETERPDVEDVPATEATPPASPVAPVTEASPSRSVHAAAAEEEEEDKEDEQQAGEADEDQAKESDEDRVEFRGHWEKVVPDQLDRTHISQFFEPPSPSALEIAQSTIINSVTGAHRTPQRSRRLSHPDSGSTPPSAAMTPGQRRRARRSSTGSLGTPGSRTPGSRTPGSRLSIQSSQSDLMSQLEDVIGQRMTPPRRKSLDRLIPVSQATEADANELIQQLQFETAQDASSVCCALYWASGDANVARDFLRGQAPPEMWSPPEDQLLVDYMRLDVTEADIANARHRGAFETMRTKRSAREILRRIQFLQ